MIHPPRIRCHYCGRRILASSVNCPNCQHNPRAFYWKRWHVYLLLAVLGLAVVGAGIVFRNDLGSILSASVALNATSTPTSTRAPITVIIVATRAATPTRVPPTRTRVPPSATARSVSATKSPTATWTATRLTRTPATETPSAIPTRIPVPAPRPIAPADGERILGANKRVVMQFQPVQPLRAQEWYRIQVDYLDREGQGVSWCAFTKESELEFPRDFFDDSSPNVRSFLWRVNVVRSAQAAPMTCDAPYDILSAPSDVWTFYWY